MPNWCYSYININSNDTEKLKNLYDKLEEWTSKNYIENGFGNSWLGNVVGFSGVDEWVEEKGFKSGTRCRGRIIYLELESDNSIGVNTETAWSPMMKMWYKICNKYLGEDNYEIFVTAEECGCGLYVSNNPYYIGNYYIDIWEDYDYYEDIFNNRDSCKENELIEALQKILDSKLTDVNELLKIFHESEHSDNVSINKYDEFNPNDFD